MATESTATATKTSSAKKSTKRDASKKVKASAKKASAKKGKAAKTAKAITVRKPNPLHDKLIKLFTRPNGATMHDTVEAGFKYPAKAALKIAERRGYKINVVPKKNGSGELTRYIARR